jgi:bacterial leucyl aminopeptidase
VPITAPASGATVSGTAAAITVTKAAGVASVNVYIDGVFFASTSPATFSWNSTTVPDGSHSISATAFATNSTVLGAISITVTVAN